MSGPKANQVICPRCGEVRLETPPGTTALPTLGMARKAAGTAGECDCGRAPNERPAAISHEAGAPTGRRGVSSPPPDGQ
jgi:hypothetical protein